MTAVLEEVEYSCGVMFDELVLPYRIQVFVKDHDCCDHIEKLFYACDYAPCCIHCGQDLNEDEEDDNADVYPQCNECTATPIKKRLCKE